MKTKHIDRKRRTTAVAAAQKSQGSSSDEAALASAGRAEATSAGPAGDAEGAGPESGPKSRSGKRPANNAHPPKAHPGAKVGAQRPQVAQQAGQSAPAARGGPTAEKTPPSRAARQGTKKAKVLALLQRPQGATLAELRQATGWQPHSVRGFLSGTLHQQMRLHLQSSKRPDGERVYSLRG